MTDRTDELASLFTARVTDEDGRYRVSIPKRLVERGQITDGDVLRVALIDGDDARRSEPTHSADAPSDSSPDDVPSTDATSTDATSTDSHSVTVAGRRTPSDAGTAPASTTETTTSSRSETTRTERPPTEAGTTMRAGPNGPPVTEGERRTVTIETLGDEGDGIAKVERGYVVIVSDAEPGDSVTVEITNVRENVSFASIVSE
jgi:predicted RNA-binding protein with TRAM domain